MVSRASPMAAPQNPTPCRACWGRLVRDSGQQGGSLGAPQGGVASEIPGKGGEKPGWHIGWDRKVWSR